jgi:hypothetical protein
LSRFQPLINGAPCLLLRHPLSGDGTYSFDIADGRIRAIYGLAAICVELSVRT